MVAHLRNDGGQIYVKIWLVRRQYLKGVPHYQRFDLPLPHIAVQAWPEVPGNQHDFKSTVSEIRQLFEALARAVRLRK